MTRYVGFTAGVLLVLALGASGCRKPAGVNANAGGGQNQPGVAPANPGGNPPPQPAGGGGGPAPQNAGGMDVKRTINKGGAMNELHQIALFYQQFNTEMGRSPGKVEEFIDYIKRDAPRATKNLQDGAYVLVLNARMGSNSVLSYEKEPDRNGIQYVALGDGSVQKMTPEQLKAALGQ
jgi:hypothetical protein